jgi:hypothetical protein
MTRPTSYRLAIAAAACAAACSGTNTGGSQPTIVLQPGGTDGIVALVSSLSPDQPTPDYGYVGASAWTWSGEPGVQHGYLNFDFSAVPLGAQVRRATLTLTGGGTAPDSLFAESTLSGANTAVISRVTSPWDEATLTWNSQPATTADGAITIGPSLSPDQVFDVDVTAQVRAMLSSGQTYGFAFQLVDEQYYRSMMFAGSNQPSAATRPRLTLELSGAD